MDGREESNKSEQDAEVVDECSCSDVNTNEYIPNEPNVLEFLQSRAPGGSIIQPHGQSQVITGPDGRRFIAQLYEETPAARPEDTRVSTDEESNNETDESDTSDESDNISSSQSNPSVASVSLQAGDNATTSNNDSNMARALCVNLLSELVKGSVQLFKSRNRQLKRSAEFKKLDKTAKSEVLTKLSEIKHKCNDMKESLQQNEDDLSNYVHSSQQKHPKVDNEMLPVPSSSDICQEKYEKSKIDGCSTSDNTSTACSSHMLQKRKATDLAECTEEKKFKKAKYSWQIKGKRSEKDVPSPGDSTDSGKTDDDLEPINDKNTDCRKEETLEQNVPLCSSNAKDSSTPSSEAQAPRTKEKCTYLERWQNHHIAKAIVDNAINKTLDEMNLSPRVVHPQVTNNARRGIFSNQRQRIEDEGVSQVILERGLRRPGPQDGSQSSINPFINHLTEMTENMFVATLSTSTRPLSATTYMQRFIGDRNYDSVLTVNDISTITNQVNLPLEKSEKSVSEDNIASDPTSTTTLNSLNSYESHDGNFSSTFENATPLANFCANRRDADVERRDLLTSGETAAQYSVEDSPYCIDAQNEEDKISSNLSHEEKTPLTVVEELEKNAPSQNFVLDTAVNAVINEKGLQF